MRHDWILDVLADLRGFARQNGLPLLAEELKTVSELAVLELNNLRGAPDPVPKPARTVEAAPFPGPDKG